MYRENMAQLCAVAVSGCATSGGDTDCFVHWYYFSLVAGWSCNDVGASWWRGRGWSTASWQWRWRWCCQSFRYADVMILSFCCYSPGILCAAVYIVPLLQWCVPIGVLLCRRCVTRAHDRQPSYRLSVSRQYISTRINPSQSGGTWMPLRSPPVADW